MLIWDLGRPYCFQQPELEHHEISPWFVDLANVIQKEARCWLLFSEATLQPGLQGGLVQLPAVSWTSHHLPLCPGVSALQHPWPQLSPQMPNAHLLWVGESPPSDVNTAAPFHPKRTFPSVTALWNTSLPNTLFLSSSRCFTVSLI